MRTVLFWACPECFRVRAKKEELKDQNGSTSFPMDCRNCGVTMNEIVRLIGGAKPQSSERIMDMRQSHIDAVSEHLREQGTMKQAQPAKCPKCHIGLRRSARCTDEYWVQAALPVSLGVGGTWPPTRGPFQDYCRNCAVELHPALQGMGWRTNIWPPESSGDLETGPLKCWGCGVTHYNGDYSLGRSEGCVECAPSLLYAMVTRESPHRAEGAECVFCGGGGTGCAGHTENCLYVRARRSLLLPVESCRASVCSCGYKGWDPQANTAQPMEE